MSTVRDQLLKAIANQDAAAFESGLVSAYDAGLPNDLADLLADALLMEWHTRHEDVASALQKLRDPRSVGALFEAALSRHGYLGYDEFFGLARKCTWALADIGTPEARERLQELASGQNATIAAYARKRLDRWEQELHRKGR